MSKCDHRYDCDLTSVAGLYMFTCVKCLKWKYGSKATANRLERSKKVDEL